MSIKQRLGIETPELKVVSSKDAETWLGMIPDEVDKEISSDLFQFGTLLLDQLDSHSTALDSKGTSLLGWSIALLAFLTLDWHAEQWAAITLKTIGLVATVASLIWSALALGLRDWSAPSEVDWLRHDLFNEPSRLRRYWLLSMLENHRNSAELNRKKAGDLVIAQWALAFAGLAVAALVGSQLLR